MTDNDESGHESAPEYDALVARYHAAGDADPRRPAARVGEAVRAHARMAREDAAPIVLPHRPAANQERWKLFALASIAVLGLAGLLVLQLEHGTPEQKDIALGTARPATPEVATPPSVAPRQKPHDTVVAEATPAPVLPPVAKSESKPPAFAGATASKQSAPQPAPPPAPMATAAPQAPTESGAATEALPSAFPAAQAPVAPQTAQANRADARTESSAESWSDASATARSEAESVNSAALRRRLADLAAAGGLRDSATAGRPTPGISAGAAPLRQEAPRSAGAAGAMSGLSSPSRTLAPRASGADMATALQAAATAGQADQVDRLLAQRAPIDAVDAAGRTPLMLAAMHGHVDAVQRLLAAGANTAAQDHQGLTALQHARLLGRDRIAALLEARP